MAHGMFDKGLDVTNVWQGLGGGVKEGLGGALLFGVSVVENEPLHARVRIALLLVALDESGDKLGSIVGGGQNRDKHGLGWVGLGWVGLGWVGIGSEDLRGQFLDGMLILRHGFADFRQNLSLRIYNIYVV